MEHLFYNEELDETGFPTCPYHALIRQYLSYKYVGYFNGNKEVLLHPVLNVHDGHLFNSSLYYMWKCNENKKLKSSNYQVENISNPIFYPKKYVRLEYLPLFL